MKTRLEKLITKYQIRAENNGKHYFSAPLDEKAKEFMQITPGDQPVKKTSLLTKIRKKINSIRRKTPEDYFLQFQKDIINYFYEDIRGLALNENDFLNYIAQLKNMVDDVDSQSIPDRSKWEETEQWKIYRLYHTKRKDILELADEYRRTELANNKNIVGYRSLLLDGIIDRLTEKSLYTFIKTIGENIKKVNDDISSNEYNNEQLLSLLKLHSDVLRILGKNLPFMSPHGQIHYRLGKYQFWDMMKGVCNQLELRTISKAYFENDALQKFYRYVENHINKYAEYIAISVKTCEHSPTGALNKTDHHIKRYIAFFKSYTEIADPAKLQSLKSPIDIFNILKNRLIEHIENYAVVTESLESALSSFSKLNKLLNHYEFDKDLINSANKEINEHASRKHNLLVNQISLAAKINISEAVKNLLAFNDKFFIINFKLMCDILISVVKNSESNQTIVDDIKKQFKKSSEDISRYMESNIYPLVSLCNDKNNTHIDLNIIARKDNIRSSLLLEEQENFIRCILAKRKDYFKTIDFGNFMPSNEFINHLFKSNIKQIVINQIDKPNSLSVDENIVMREVNGRMDLLVNIPESSSQIYSSGSSVTRRLNTINFNTLLKRMEGKVQKFVDRVMKLR